MEPINIANLLEENNIIPIDDSMCSICLTNIEDQPNYTLPECNHSFHISCIIPWFRNHNQSCPCCRSLGNGEIIYNRLDVGERYKMIRNIARRKNAPNHLKKLVQKLVNINKKQKEKRQILNDWKKSPDGVLFNNLNKIFKKLRFGRNNYKHFRKIRELKHAISNYPIIPFILKK